MKKLFIFGDSYSDWCNKDEKSHQNGETLTKEDFWFQKLADYKKYSLWNYGRSGYGAPGCFREFMSYIDEITEDDIREYVRNIVREKFEQEMSDDDFEDELKELIDELEDEMIMDEVLEEMGMEYSE